MEILTKHRTKEQFYGMMRDLMVDKEKRICEREMIAHNKYLDNNMVWCVTRYISILVEERL